MEYSTDQIINPVLRGFHPDPCICRARGTYYMITSTFEWLPGISLYESQDLVNWTSKGGILKETDLQGIPDSAGIWAPALSYDNGTFYLVYTVSRQIDGYFKDVENYVVTASSIEGPWSSPVFINASGFDPSMYHEDGRHYVLNPQWDSRPLKGHRKFNGLILQEFDLEKGMTGPSRMVFGGSATGGTEGPHLMKKDGYYYIIAAEGGTGRHHSICAARSKHLWGPYEVSPFHPLITAWEKETVLKKSGHGNFVETEQGEWYMTHLCARYLDNRPLCVLGRETALQKLEWIDGWPRMVQGDSTPLTVVEAPGHIKKEFWENAQAPAHRPCSYRTTFPIGADLEKEEWLSLRIPLSRKAGLTGEGLCLKGNDSLTSLFGQSLIGRRWQSFTFTAETALTFHPYHYSQTAGLVCYYNTKVFHYLYVGYDEKRKQRMINILTNDNFSFHEPLEGNYVYLPDTAVTAHLKVCVSQENLQFYYAAGQDFQKENLQKKNVRKESLQRKNPWKKIGPVLDASILSDEHAPGWAYTGAMVGITAVDNFNKDTYAVFTEFSQEDII